MLLNFRFIATKRPNLTVAERRLEVFRRSRDATSHACPCNPRISFTIGTCFFKMRFFALTVTALRRRENCYHKTGNRDGVDSRTKSLLKVESRVMSYTGCFKRKSEYFLQRIALDRLRWTAIENLLTPFMCGNLYRLSNRSH